MLSHIDRRAWGALLLLTLVVSVWGSARSHILAADATAEPAAKNEIEAVTAKREALAAQMAALVKVDVNETEDADITNVSAAEEETELLETMDAVYVQQLGRLEQRQELAASKKKLLDDLETLRKFGPSEAKPYSFLLLENLRDELAIQEDRTRASLTDIKSSQQLLDAAQTHFDECEAERRQAKEDVDENDDEEAAAELANALRLAKYRSQIAQEQVTLRRLDVEVRTLRNEVHAAQQEYLSTKIERIAKDVKFTKQDLAARVRELATFEEETNRKLRGARGRLQQSARKQAAEIKELQDQQVPQATIDLANLSWRVARDARQTEISLLNERLGESRRFRHYWTCRFEVENGTVDNDQIEEWHESLGALVDELHDNRRSLEQRLDLARDEISRVTRSLRQSDSPDEQRWGEVQIAGWQALREACEANLVQLKASERWSNRFLEQLALKLHPPEEPWWQTAYAQFNVVWDYEITAIDDRSITLGKIVKLLTYLLFGTLLANVLSKFTARSVLPRLGLNQGASKAVQKIAFYTLAVLFGTISFQLVQIPFAAFAFLGGAAAIAIGFGSQDIANNFMSGIIILAEQPIRVGDVIVFESVQGIVTHIGARSTWIRTDANYELIVPNSRLLGDKVTNLTLSDDLVQTSTPVYVPVAKSMAQAKEALLRAALSHPGVLRSPAPQVLYKLTGASTMEFEVRFWLHLRDNMQITVVQSDVRELANDLLQQQDTPSLSISRATKAA